MFANQLPWLMASCLCDYKWFNYIKIKLKIFSLVSTPETRCRDHSASFSSSSFSWCFPQFDPGIPAPLPSGSRPLGSTLPFAQRGVSALQGRWAGRWGPPLQKWHPLLHFLWWGRKAFLHWSTKNSIQISVLEKANPTPLSISMNFSLNLQP